MTIKPEDAKKAREFFTTLLTGLNSFAGLGGELGDLVKALKSQYNAIIEQLPMTDAVPAAQQANYNLEAFFSCLTSMQAILSYMNSHMANMRTEHEKALTAANSAAPAKLAEAITAAIDTKVSAGDLVPKDKVTHLCSAAKDAGMVEGETKVRQEVKAREEKLKVIGERKTLVTTNSLPLPNADALLDGTEDQFKSAQETAKRRNEILTSKGLALNSPLRADVWETEAVFNKTVAMLETFVGGRPGNPFAGATGDGGNARPAIGCV